MASSTTKSQQQILMEVHDEVNAALRVNVAAGGAGDGSILDGVLSSIKATVKDLTNSNPLATALVDANGDQITSFGGGTQYNDGAARGSATGTLALGDDGTYLQSLACSAAGRLSVDVNSSALPSGAATSALQTQPGVDVGDVTINNASGASAVNVQDGGNSLTVDGTITANLAAGTNTNEVVGDAAHDAAIAGNPVRVAGRALTTDYTAVAAGDTADLITTLTGKIVNYPFANPNQSWSYAAASGGIVNTTGVTIKAAGGSGVRLYLTDLHVINGHATVSTDVQIRDGASGTVLWRGFAQAAGGGISVHFVTPLRGTANTLLEVACGTTGSAIYVNAAGFIAAE